MNTTFALRPRLTAALASAALAAGLGAVATASSASATPTATVMATTQRMAGPALPPTYQQVGTYGAGGQVALNCYARGQSVKGYYSPWIPGGYDNLWYKTSDGYWLADVDINTGSNNPITPACSPSTSSSRAWGATRSYNAGVLGQCTDGAYRQFRAYSGVYPALNGNAKDWYASARATGWSTALDGQVNSIVVFQAGVQGAGSLGHVGWVDAVSTHTDGLYVHVVEFNYAGQGAVWHTRWVKDVVGMSYILAPHN
ncbi:MAG: CHAP domain-containing protein [Ornithinibacter sp.]